MNRLECLQLYPKKYRKIVYLEAPTVRLKGDIEANPTILKAELDKSYGCIKPIITGLYGVFAIERIQQEIPLEEKCPAIR